MPITLNGNGTVTGVSVGGLPDGIVDTDMLAANAVSSAKLASGVGGKILQVKATTKTDTFTTTSGTFTDVTGLSVDITPSSTSSKILVTVNVTGSGRGGSARSPVRLLRDSTPIGNATDVGNRKASFGVLYSGSDDSGIATANIQFLDSPNTTSSVTYKVQIVNGNNNGSTIVVNRTYNDTDSATGQRYSSSITAEEVAA